MIIEQIGMSQKFIEDDLRNVGLPVGAWNWRSTCDLLVYHGNPKQLASSLENAMPKYALVLGGSPHSVATSQSSLEELQAKGTRPYCLPWGIGPHDNCRRSEEPEFRALKRFLKDAADLDAKTEPNWELLDLKYVGWTALLLLYLTLKAGLEVPPNLLRTARAELTGAGLTLSAVFDASSGLEADTVFRALQDIESLVRVDPQR